MKILLSPAKSIQIPESYPKIGPTTGKFLKETETLVKKMKKFSPKKLAALYSVSNDIAELNYNRFQNWESPVEAGENILPAVFAFNGEVYRGLNVTELSPEEMDYINGHVRILSGLYGLLQPYDLIYPYRLEMGTKLEVSAKAKNLYQFWGDKISNALNAEETDVIVNLASAEYFKAVNAKKIKAKIITPVFKEFKNGEYKMLMTYAKNARGEMARYCAQNKIETAEDLKSFNLSNYRFMPEMSTDEEYVFVR
ncbi:MAG: hypothetical protein K0R65_2256 [Crocinitomicaceae bacterium]|jgi:cytoplasmic iron level regulating protein YaaA (DUF328/UPF0246 family)|nr:hypothetical protein [Crocinitomicaceae bacterium]